MFYSLKYIQIMQLWKNQLWILGCKEGLTT